MEVAGVGFRPSPCFSSSTADAVNSRHLHSFSTMKQPRSFCLKQQPNRKSLAALAGSGSDEFSDEGHLQYYNYRNGARMVMKEKEIASKKKEMKKKLKLLKGLSKDLSTFSDMGFGLNPDNGLDHQVKGQMISEATELLLGQLQKLRAEKLESKRKKKEEKAKKKAARMMMDCKKSSSESSSSSESECENVVNTIQLKSAENPNAHQEAISSLALPRVVPVQILDVEKKGTKNASSKCCSGTANCEDPSNVGLSIDHKSDGSSVPCNKIEVCMGGKCKKSGAAMLLENFQKAVGGEAAVVGCKCMGKCRDGPNVRVRSNGDAVANPLCIGVGLEDVDLIVTNFIGGRQRSCSDIVPALSSV